MRLKLTTPVLTLLLFVLFVPLRANSTCYQENPLTKAIQLFDKGNYAQAEPLFKELIDLRPDDFMINYFYGACRTNNGHYSDQDLAFLLKASKEVNPVDIDYYIGVQQHARNNWENAMARYEAYQKSASAADQKSMGLAEKMEQCRNQVNPFVSDREIEPTPLVRKAEGKAEEEAKAEAEAEEKEEEEEGSKQLVAEKDSTFATEDETALEQPGAAAGTTAVTEVEINFTPINFNINEQITYRSTAQLKTSEGKDLYERASEKQQELARTLSRANILRDRYVALRSRSEQDSVGQLILAAEHQAYELKEEANQLLLQAKMAEKEYWKNATPDEVDRFLMSATVSAQKQATPTEKVKALPDSVELLIPTILIGEPGMVNQAAEAGSADLVYKIQIGAFSRGIPNYLQPMFKKISLLRKVENYTDEKGVTVYTTGNLTKLDDALLMQKQVRQEGAEDAYIVPFLKGKRITLELAKEIEGIK